MWSKRLEVVLGVELSFTMFAFSIEFMSKLVGPWKRRWVTTTKYHEVGLLYSLACAHYDKVIRVACTWDNHNSADWVQERREEPQQEMPTAGLPTKRRRKIKDGSTNIINHNFRKAVHVHLIRDVECLWFGISGGSKESHDKSLKGEEVVDSFWGR